MTINDFLQKLTDSPESIEFSDTMAVIAANYVFTETAFQNGELHNDAGENSGSCQLFAFAQRQNLSATQTLACFGRYYHEDVLPHPEGSDHQNIRNFMQHGWAGIEFSGLALNEKSE